jgi:uncharacterized protein YjiS (DUF1127 family)
MLHAQKLRQRALRRYWRRLWRRLMRWQRQRAGLHALAALNARELADLGLDHGALPAAARGKYFSARRQRGLDTP